MLDQIFPMIFLDYVRALFSKWWSGLVLLLGLASTVATFLPSLFSRFHLVIWAPPAIAVFCWLAAPVSVYLAQHRKISELQAKLADVAGREERSELLIREHGESRFFYETIDARKITTATRVFLSLSIENSGKRNATISEYHLSFPLFKNEFDLTPDSVQSFESRIALHPLSPDRFLTTDGLVRIPANTVVGPKELTFRIPHLFPTCQRELECILKITDTRGSDATYIFRLHAGDLPGPAS
jgi:hypothetical protein